MKGAYSANEPTVKPLKDKGNLTYGFVVGTVRNETYKCIAQYEGSKNECMAIQIRGMEGCVAGPFRITR